MSCSRMIRLILIAICVTIPLWSQQTTHPTPAAPPLEKPKAADLPFASLTEFSAIMVGGILGNIDELQIYRSGNLMRTEMLDGNYMVTNLDSRDTFVVLPDRCAHDASPSVNTFPFSLFHAGLKVDRTPLGTEVVEGHTCQVEEITVSTEHGQPLKLKFWEATDLSGFPVKFELYRVTGTPVTVSYKDIKIGRPDPAVFQLPAKCPQTAVKGKRSTGKGSKPAATEKKAPR